jgi:hypothetical protein
VGDELEVAKEMNDSRKPYSSDTTGGQSLVANEELAILLSEDVIRHGSYVEIIPKSLTES